MLPHIISTTATANSKCLHRSWLRTINPHRDLQIMHNNREKKHYFFITFNMFNVSSLALEPQIMTDQILNSHLTKLYQRSEEIYAWFK